MQAVDLIEQRSGHVWSGQTVAHQGVGPEPVERRIEHRDHQVLPGCVTTEAGKERSGDGLRGGEGGGLVADECSDEVRNGNVAALLDADHPGDCLHDWVVHPPLAVRAGRAESAY